jgi:hypothetical protein
MNTELLPKQRSADRAEVLTKLINKALEEGVTPLELCTRFWKLHTEIYESVSYLEFADQADQVAGSS